MNTVAKRSLLWAFLVGLLLFDRGIVFANAAPPPLKLWFTFEYAVSPSPNLEAVQLVVCATEACESPVFVQRYAVCDAPGCLVNPPGPPDRATFECFDNRCLGTIPYPYYEHEYFLLIAQFSDRVRESAVLGGLPTEWGGESAWLVQVQDEALILQVDGDFINPYQPYGNILSGLALTLVVELLVVGVGLWFWKREERASLAGRLLLVGLINLLTYPLVWLVFPSLRQFQPLYLRTMSLYVGIAALVYVAALLWIYLSDKRKRRLGIILTLVSLPATAICLLFVLIVVGYGSYAVAVPGLSPDLALLFTELFVIMAEAALLFVLSRKSLSALQAGVLSLLMNLASFLAGQAVFH
jgi:hypothetical protein